jgi:fatty acid desaturase
MPRSDESVARRSSVVPLLLALVVLSAAIAVLSFLTLGFFGAVLGLAFALAAFIGLQYLLWGWWLGPWIERAERLREEERDRDDASGG